MAGTGITLATVPLYWLLRPEQPSKEDTSMADTRPIGEKLRAIDEHARQSSNVPANRPENKEPAEGSRETIVGGGVSNRPAPEERQNQQRRPRRGTSKQGGHA
jgi:hypothetical protein